MNTFTASTSKKFKKTKIAFIKTSTKTFKTIQQIKQAPKVQARSNTQHYHHEKSTYGFSIEEMAKQVYISVKILCSVFTLKNKDLSELNFSNLVYFYCMVARGYISFTNLKRTAVINKPPL